MLGAGLDTFAYHNQYPENLLKIFEVDHPATQAWKRARLREMGIAVPSSLTFAPVDFERQSLAEELARAGFRSDRPAFFSWLGVVLYLTEAAVMDTLRYVASLAPKSEVVFEFSVPAAFLYGQRRRSREASAANAAKLGEPWITFFEPYALTERLRTRGFVQTTRLAPRDADRRYFDGRTDGLRAGGVYLMAPCV